MKRISETEYQAMAELRYRIRLFLRESDAAARSAGLEPQQYLLLLCIRGIPDDDSTKIRSLADSLLIKHHSAVGMVNRLEQQGMVRRERAGADRRKVAVRLTERGARVFAKLASVHMRELRRIAPDLERFFGYFARGVNRKRRARS